MMRAARWNRQICFLITLMMLLTGMCFDTIKADSSFSSEESPFETHAAYMMRSSTANQDMMIEDQTQDFYECVDRQEEQVRASRLTRRSNHGPVIMLDTGLEESFVSFHKTAHVHSARWSGAVIIGYVHSKDGSKRISL